MKQSSTVSLSIIEFIFIIERSEEIGSLQRRMNSLHQEMISRRGQVDSLSTQMATLSRHHTSLKSKNAEMTKHIKNLTKTISILKQKPASGST